MATKEAKPNGQFLLDSRNDILAYMAPMSLDLLPGVGSSISHKLKQAGLNNCGDVQNTTLEKMEKVLGKKLGQNLFQNCRGIDDRPLAYEQVGVQILLRPTYLFLVPYFSFRSAKPFPPK